MLHKLENVFGVTFKFRKKKIIFCYSSEFFEKIIRKKSWEQDESDGACQFSVRLLFRKIKKLCEITSGQVLSEISIFVCSSQFDIVEGFSGPVVMDRNHFYHSPHTSEKGIFTTYWCVIAIKKSFLISLTNNRTFRQRMG